MLVGFHFGGQLGSGVGVGLTVKQPQVCGVDAQDTQIPSAYAGTWGSGESPYPGSSRDGIHVFRFTPAQAFDLSQVESITIGSTTYPFPQAADLGA